MDTRQRIWQALGSEWKFDGLEEIATERTLQQLEPEIQRILRGQQTGRILVDLTA
jgi:hypothetical protein